ncbi:PREDICTED: uncharacterized protein LOC105557049 [Vollenhovia emeryi]|uniref:uncharacterized protein LOC105557049 n=1 Tax=Vollenhovia emeryi TaxID=411798 RepID=UPI0005F51F11|nr:PREDICTED: uncharacterized protein LOC105557049 [Vollenhovia emeryi]
MENQFAKHHGARQRQLAVGDRVVVHTRNGKRELGSILELISEVRCGVRLDNGKTVERHINHIWKGGTIDRSPGQAEDTEMNADLISNPNPDPAPEPDPEPAPEPMAPITEGPPTPPRTQDPNNRAHEEASVVTTPRRSTRMRAPPKRLALDPRIKSYSEL